MKQGLKFLILAMVSVSCINMGTGTYSQGVNGDQPVYFELKDGKDVFFGKFGDNGTSRVGTKICFYNPNDPDCRSKGEPAGEVYLEVF